MSERDERVEALAAVLAQHHIEIEHRAYPTFACAFEDWDGAEGDNGGDMDGIHDTRYGHGLHLAQALIDSPAMRDLLAEAFTEGAWAAYAIERDGGDGSEAPNPYRSEDER